jgi:hypothetical protein
MHAFVLHNAHPFTSANSIFDGLRDVERISNFASNYHRILGDVSLEGELCAILNSIVTANPTSTPYSAPSRGVIHSGVS